jgi:hypothetical protein
VPECLKKGMRHEKGRAGGMINSNMNMNITTNRVISN